MKPIFVYVFRVYHVLLALLLAGIVVYVVYLHLDVDGTQVLVHTPDNQHVMVRGPEPEMRRIVTSSFGQDSLWEVLIDPVYFHVFIPRQYKTVTVTLEYKAENVPVVQIGGLVDRAGWSFAWHGVQHLPLEEKEDSCLRDIERAWWLCQQEPVYRSIERFLLGPPHRAPILLYNFSLPEGFEKLTTNTYNHTLSLDDYQYVLATYTPPIELAGGWRRASATFDFATLAEYDQRLQFALSAPSISDSGQKILIRSIAFTYEKPPLSWQDILTRIGKKIGF